MNLLPDDEEYVYIVFFDIPVEGSIVGFQTQTLAQIFELNTHIS